MTKIQIISAEVLNQYALIVSFDALGVNDDVLTTLQTNIWLTPEQLDRLEESIVQAKVTMQEKIQAMKERESNDVS